MGGPSIAPSEKLDIPVIRTGRIARADTGRDRATIAPRETACARPSTRSASAPRRRGHRPGGGVQHSQISVNLRICRNAPSRFGTAQHRTAIARLLRCARPTAAASAPAAATAPPTAPVQSRSLLMTTKDAVLMLYIKGSQQTHGRCFECDRGQAASEQDPADVGHDPGPVGGCGDLRTAASDILHLESAFRTGADRSLDKPHSSRSKGTFRV